MARIWRGHRVPPAYKGTPQQSQTVGSMLKVALPKLLIKVVIMTVVLFILTLPSIKLFNAITGIGLVTAFSSPIFLGSFVILFILFSVYDFATSHKVWALENVTACLLVFILLASLAFSIILILVSFVLILIGLILGASLRQLSFKQRGMTKAVNPSEYTRLEIYSTAPMIYLLAKDLFIGHKLGIKPTFKAYAEKYRHYKSNNATKNKAIAEVGMVEYINLDKHRDVILEVQKATGKRGVSHLIDLIEEVS